MKVLYDYQAFSWQKFGGVSNSFVQLMTNLPDGTNYDLAIQETDNIHLLEKNIAGIIPCKLSGDKFITNKFFPGKYRLYRYFTSIFPQYTSAGVNRCMAIKKLKDGDFDVFHPTFFDNYFLKFLKNKPFVLTIHDMIPELVYEDYGDPQIEAKKQLASKAAHIVAISNQTKSDIIKVLGIPEQKISVVYHGAPIIPDNLAPLELGFEYVLFVGGRNQPYKNFIPMIESIARVLLKHRELNVLCTGSEFTDVEKLKMEELHISNQVKHVFCEDIEMMRLYKGAKALIFPSLYEGFGIPILEAYATDCPLIINEKSCFPEIAGDAAIYFSLDKKQDSLGDVLEDFLSWGQDRVNALIAKQQERVKLFTWEKAAYNLNKIYQSVIDESR
ncbi:MAG: glycosyltransferase family 4 protein [Prevotellaceae bacterium]|nr:glycosyltransferase family 4 protein [Prevotellaceae bacterium]